MKKHICKAVKLLCILLVINTVFIFVVGGVIYSVALKRQEPYEAGQPVSGDSRSWLEKEGEDFFILSDGLNLHAYFVQNSDAEHKYAIICHGYGAQGSGMSYYAKQFYKMGYSVLTPDARAHGRSEGEIIGMGYIEKKDIVLWAEMITQNDPDAQIVLFGVSMGGATVLFTSGESSLPSTVRAVISDCAYTDVYNEIGSAIRYTLPWVPSFPIVDCASVICQLSGGYNLKQASCVDAVNRSITPTLFIHGSDDTYVPFSMLDTLYESCSAEKEKLVVEGAEHANSASTDGELYWKTVETFLSEYIK